MINIHCQLSTRGSFNLSLGKNKIRVHRSLFHILHPLDWTTALCCPVEESSGLLPAVSVHDIIIQTRPSSLSVSLHAQQWHAIFKVLLCDAMCHCAVMLKSDKTGLIPTSGWSGLHSFISHSTDAACFQYPRQSIHWGHWLPQGSQQAMGQVQLLPVCSPPVTQRVRCRE